LLSHGYLRPKGVSKRQRTKVYLYLNLDGWPPKIRRTAAASCSDSGRRDCGPRHRARQRRRRAGNAIPAASEGAEAGTAFEAATGRRTREGHQAGATRRHAAAAEGATIAQVVEATQWQPPTVPAALAGALKKRLGLTVTSEKADSGGRVYSVHL
jgi:Protein of unknown function (DUF3489)